MSTCTAYSRASDRTSPPCGKTATHLVSGGCIHEHVVSNPHCEHHATKLRAALETCPAICVLCHEGGEPHVCKLAISITEAQP